MTPDINFLSGTAKPGPYRTPLTMREEMEFQMWLRQNSIPYQDGPQADYDMRGYWKAMKSGDPRARTAINAADKQIHFPDVWKTPYHKSFSNESMYATQNAPRWTGDDQSGWSLVDKLGTPLVTEKPDKKAAQ